MDNEKDPIFRKIVQNLAKRPKPMEKDEIAEGSVGEFEIVRALTHSIGPSLRNAAKIREVDSGSCGACELEIAALSYPQYDMERFGFDLVASPRHADLFFVTGPVTRNMKQATKLSVEAAPVPRFVVAVGDCACGKGPFVHSYATLGGVEKLLDVDLKVFGCPPEPQTILRALMKFLGY